MYYAYYMYSRTVIYSCDPIVRTSFSWGVYSISPLNKGSQRIKFGGVVRTPWRSNSLSCSVFNTAGSFGLEHFGGERAKIANRNRNDVPSQGSNRRVIPQKERNFSSEIADQIAIASDGCSHL